MIFEKWDTVYSNKGKMFILVDNNYKIDVTNNCIKDFSSFSLDYKCDFVNLNNSNLLLYVAYRREYKDWSVNVPAHFETFIFLKNKLYDFQSWKDELGNKVGEIWYDPFMFVREENYEKAIRSLKLKTLKTLKDV